MTRALWEEVDRHVLRWGARGWAGGWVKGWVRGWVGEGVGEGWGAVVVNKRVM